MKKILTAIALSATALLATTTTWSTDQILTENYTIPAGDTLVIEAGVKILPVFIDGNANGDGDISFTINGVLISNGTETNPVLFESYDKKDQNNAWQGITLNGSNQTISHIKVRNTITGLNVVGDGNTITLLYVDSLQTGINITGQNTEFLSSTVQNCESGIIATGANGLVLSDLRVLNNSSVGIKLSSTSASITGITAKLNNGLGGIYTTGAGTANISYSTLDSNISYGLFVDVTANVNVTNSTIINNGKAGIVVRSNSVNAITLESSNIYGNGIGNGTTEDLISVTNLSLKSIKTYKFPTYTKTIKSHQLLYSNNSDCYYNLTVGSWSSRKYYGNNFNRTDTFSTLPHSTESISIYHHPYLYQGQIDSYGFTHPYQLIYLTGSTTNKLIAKNNWWGQFTRIDTLIGTQTLVDYTGFKTSEILDAGAENYKSKIVVTPQSLTFGNVPVSYPDTLDVTVTNSGGAPLYLDSVVVEGESYTVINISTSILGGVTDTFNVIFDPATATPYNGYLSIYSSDEISPLTQVLLSGTGRQYNYKPVFVGKPTDTLTIAGDLFERTIFATDSNGTPDTLSFSLLHAPATMTIGSKSGVISWSSVLSAVDDSVVIQVEDLQGLTDTTSFKLTVNHRPEFLGTLPANQSIPWGTSYIKDINAIDADGHSLTYLLDSTVGNMIMSSSSGLINYNAVKNDIGSHPIQIRVTDELGADVIHSFVLTVTDTGEVLTSAISLSITAHRFDSIVVNEKVYLPVIISNSGNGTLVLDSVVVGTPFDGTYKNREVPAGQTDTLMLSFAPTAIIGYEDTLRLYNNDPTQPVLKLPLSGTVVNKNTSPYFVNRYPDTTITAGDSISLFTYPVAKDDTPNDDLSYDLIDGSDYVSFDKTNGSFGWQTVSNTPTDTFVVKVSDNYGLFVLDTFVVTIDGETAISLIDDQENSGVSDLIIAPNPVDQNANGVSLIIPTELSGDWQITIYDAVGNLMDEAEFTATGGTTYRWDLHTNYGTRVASGSYVLIGKFTDNSGRSQLFKRIIGVRQ